MNLTDRNYQAAESNYHKALEILQRSPLVSTEPYIEAMAVITYEVSEKLHHTVTQLICIVVRRVVHNQGRLG